MEAVNDLRREDLRKATAAMRAVQATEVVNRAAALLLAVAVEVDAVVDVDVRLRTLTELVRTRARLVHAQDRWTLLGIPLSRHVRQSLTSSCLTPLTYSFSHVTSSILCISQSPRFDAS